MSLFRNRRDEELDFELDGEHFPALRNARNVGGELFESFASRFDRSTISENASDEPVAAPAESAETPAQHADAQPEPAYDADVLRESEAMLDDARRVAELPAYAEEDGEYIPRRKRHRMKPLPKKKRDGTYNFERPELPHIPADDRRDDDHIPTLFADVGLDREKAPVQPKKPEDGERLPTLLEFLNEPADDERFAAAVSAEEEAAEEEAEAAAEKEAKAAEAEAEAVADEEDDEPLPELFANIRKEYRPSADVMRLAGEADALEAERAQSGKADGAADETEQPEPEAAPDTDELFGMIGSIAREQVELIRRLRTERMNEIRTGVPKDPYNMSFNDRPLRTNLEDIPEIPLEQIVIETAAQRGMDQEIIFEDDFD